nr:zinc finger BED domain-containing protein 5-like [Parasteatoda tepidariorum]
MPPKKRSHHQAFKDDYAKEFPVLKRSKASENHAYCITCDMDFTIAHGGLYDCRRHVECERHKKNAERLATNKKINALFSSSSDDLKVIRAEALFTNFILEHNLPIAVADHARPLFKKMFQDSDTAAKYGCARTKTTAIINCLATNTGNELTNILKTTKFSLATDASNSHSSDKIFPLIVGIIDDARITTRLLSLAKLNGDATGQNMFQLLHEELSKRSIPWSNCIAFSCDNASSMIGKHKGLTKYLLEKNSKMIINKCACHLLHLAAKKGAKELPLNVEDFLIDVFYYFKKSSKRIEAFKACQIFCDLDNHKILKYVATRWLSLLNVIERFLEQWDSLSLFFQNEDGTSEKCRKIKKMFLDPRTKLYLLFLESVLPLFCSVNVLLQSEEPLIHCLRRELEMLLTKLIARYISPVSVKEAKSIRTIEFSNRKRQKLNEDLVIGCKTRQFLKENSLTEDVVSAFYLSVRNFYSLSCKYISEKFPLEDAALLNAEVADINLRLEKSFSAINYFVDLFCEDFSDLQKGALEEEFALYQIDNFSEDVIKNNKPAEVWSMIEKIKDQKGCLKYNILPIVMKRILLIPHSNVPCERLFSLVRKNQNDFRGNLSLSTLQSILIQKSKMISKNELCYERNFTKEELAKAKKATSIALQSK